MYPELQKEIATYEHRTPKSAESYKRNLKRIPLGVASNYRAYDPYPIFVKEGQGSHFRDLDGNDYIDHNLCFWCEHRRPLSSCGHEGYGEMFDHGNDLRHAT